MIEYVVMDYLKACLRAVTVSSQPEDSDQASAPPPKKKFFFVLIIFGYPLFSRCAHQVHGWMPCRVQSRPWPDCVLCAHWIDSSRL